MWNTWKTLTASLKMANPRKSGKRTVCLSVCGLSVVVVVLLIILIYLATKPHPCEEGIVNFLYFGKTSVHRMSRICL